MATKIQLKTHGFRLHFQDGGSCMVYSEDEFDSEEERLCLTVKDGFELKLKSLGEAGMIKVGDNTYRPHHQIRYVEHVSSDVTQVLEVEFNDTYQLWDIIEEE